MAGPPQSTIGKKLPSGAPMPSSTKRHREEAAKQGTGAEHLRTRVLAFAAAALAFAASGSGQLEATIRHHHKICEKELDIPENGIPLSEAGE